MPLKTALQYLRDEVAPQASEIDQSSEALRLALTGLCEGGWMALRRPVAYGGPQLPEADFRRFQLEVARVSGTLAFLQTQHQSAVSMISKCENEELMARVLPRCHNGETLIAIAFSQLRRPGPPILRATPVPGGFQIDGHIPWITGFTFFDQMLVGATLPDGRALFALTPFVGGAGMQLSEPMLLAAMEPAQTVTAEVTGLFIPDTNLVSTRDSDWAHRNDLINVTLQAFFALGNCQASLDVLASVAERRKAEFLDSSLASFRREWESCLAQVSAPPESIEDRIRIRAWAIELMGRLAHAAVVVSSGAANSVSHPAQRIYREALVFTVSAQTQPIMEATLARLVRD